MRRGTGRVYKDGKTWMIDIYLNGERVRRSGGRTRREADRALKALQEVRKEDRQPVFLSEVLKAYLASLRVNAKRSTVSSSTCHAQKVEDYFGPSLDVGELTKSMIDEFKEYRLRTVSRSTANGSLRVLRAALKHSGQPSPIKLLRETTKLPKVLNPKDVNRLIELANSPVDLIIMTGAFAGLRHAEILHLQRRDIDLAAGTLEVTAKADWSPKSHCERSVPLHPRLAEAFANHLDTLDEGNPWVFPGYEEGPRVTVSKLVRRVFKAAGLYDKAAKPGLHALRRTWATELLGKGVDIETVRQMGGWSTLGIVQKYVTSSDERKRDAISKLG